MDRKIYILGDGLVNVLGGIIADILEDAGWARSWIEA